MPGERNKLIYLDNQSTTPIDPRVQQAMLPYIVTEFGNPHSNEHIFGRRAREAVEDAREKIAQLINADPREIILTSGATESCNLAIQGVAGKASKARNKVITAATEHSCVLETCKALRRKGHEVVVLPVKSDGLIDLGVLEKEIDDKTILVSIMLANNEIGVIQPLAKIAEVCRKYGALFHSDATQAVGKIPVDVDNPEIDFMSFSAHKLYGPKGVGALYARWDKQTKIEAILHGGQQEGGIRSGTIPTFLVAGFGEACEIVENELEEDIEHTRALTKRIFEGLKNCIPDLGVVGSTKMRLPGNLSVSFPNMTGADLVAHLGEKIAISTGSACKSGNIDSSHVLKALNISEVIAYNTVRISPGRFNTIDEIDVAVAAILATLR